jgi:hypothetical protein
MKTLRRLTTMCLMSVCFILVCWHRAGADVALQLVSARDHLVGAFTTPATLYADADRIYLASALSGQLFVLARDRAADFPLLEVIEDSTLPLSAVAGDKNHLYVGATDGNIRVYEKTFPLSLVDTIPIATFRINSIQVLGKDIYIALGFTSLAVDQKRLYLSELNEGDVVKLLSSERTFGETFEPNTTMIFDRKKGNLITTLSNPSGLGGSTVAVDLYSNGKLLIQTAPGCCGTGVSIHNEKTFGLDQTITRTAANATVISSDLLIVGTELGTVDVFDLKNNPSPILSSANLRTLTGHTGSEDIEVRALWADNVDHLIFAASSGGNDQSRGPLLPTFFVLELVRTK